MRTVSYAQGCSNHYTGKIGIVLCSQQSWNKLCLTGEPSKIMFPKVFKCHGENVHDLDKERNKSRYKATNVWCVWCVCVYIYINVHVSPGGGHGSPFQYSCLENPMDRGTWRATVHRVTESQTWLKWLSAHTYIYSTQYDDMLIFCCCCSNKLLQTLWLTTTRINFPTSMEGRSPESVSLG